MNPVEKFPPTNGAVTGWLGVAMAVVVGAVTIVSSPGLVGVRVLLGAALVGLLIWMFVLRPRAAVDDETLLLRQEATDTLVPLTRIDGVHVGRALTVVVDGRRYLCTGISRPRPSVGRRPGARGAGPGSRSGHVGAEVGADAASYVENRVREMVASAHRRTDPGSEEPAVRRRLAVPELAALGVLAGSLAVALLL